MSRLFILIQRLLPHHLFSRLVGWFMGRRLWKNWLIRTFAKRYGVDFSEAEREDACDYESFNDFFTRRLKPGMRPLPAEVNAVVQPADGAISQLGPIKGQQIFQAKGHDYSCQALLACSEVEAKQFHNGTFATVYLSPKDYHRVHMPYTGSLRSMIYVPGSLFSVNPATTAAITGLFARNERVVSLFDTEIGPMAVVLVGAMIVASIETSWAGQICPGRSKPGVERIDYPADNRITLQTGDELGLFKTGSTVIVLFAQDAIQLEQSLTAGSNVQMGQLLARTHSSNPSTQH
jgi:phosphatidylserine decarboxylase